MDTTDASTFHNQSQHRDGQSLSHQRSDNSASSILRSQSETFDVVKSQRGSTLSDGEIQYNLGKSIVNPSPKFPFPTDYTEYSTGHSPLSPELGKEIDVYSSNTEYSPSSHSHSMYHGQPFGSEYP